MICLLKGHLCPSVAVFRRKSHIFCNCNPPLTSEKPRSSRLTVRPHGQRSTGVFRRHSHGASVLCLSPPLAALYSHAWPFAVAYAAQGCTRNRTSPVAVEESPFWRDRSGHSTATDYGGARAIRDSPFDVGARCMSHISRQGILSRNRGHLFYRKFVGVFISLV